MARKRSRAAVGNTDSVDSTEKYESKGSCPHITKGVDMGNLKRAMKRKEDLKCQSCKRKQRVATQKSAGPLDFLVCMFCGHIGCGVNQFNHANEHFCGIYSDCHSIVAVIDTWTVRCLQCRLNVKLESNAIASHAIAFLKKNLPVAKAEDNAVNDEMNTPSITEKVDKKSTFTIHDVKTKPGSLLSRRVAPVLGLENIGNTCYMNSILQCLAQTPYLVASLKDASQSGIPFKLSGGENLVNKEYGEVLPPLEGSLGEAGQLSKMLHKVLSKVKNGEELRRTGIYSENPSEVLRALKKFSNTFYVGEQHDSHELLRFLLEGLKTEDLKRYQRGILKSMSISTASKEVLPKEREFLIAYKKQVILKELFVDKIFGGSIVSILKCLECGQVTTNVETFMDVSLPVESEKIKSCERPISGTEIRMSKHQLKKERRLAKKGKKKNRTPRFQADVCPREESNKSNSSNESASESEADVEDNADSENTPRTIEDDDSRISSGPLLDSEISVTSKEDVVSLEDSSYDTEVSCPLSPAYTSESGETACDPNSGATVLGCSPEPKIPEDNDSLIPFVGSSIHELKPELYGLSPETPTVTYGGSPEPSLNEDFGSCEGGRGSTASSIEQADWDEVNRKVEYNTLAQEVEKALILSQDESCEIPIPETFDPLINDVFHEEGLTLPVGSGDDSELTVENSPKQLELFSDSNSSGRALHRGLEDAEISDCYQAFNVHKLDTSDEAYDNLVEVQIGREENDKEGSIKHLSDDNEHSDSSGSVWGTTLASHPELDNKTYCLEHCLREFFNEEILSGANKIGCTQCTHKKEGITPPENSKLILTNGLKQLLFLKLPNVLTLHLKRFEVMGSRMSKICRKVTFPLELDVSPYTSSRFECKITDSSPRYQLYGLVEHSGHMSSGHYVAYVKETKESPVMDKCVEGEYLTEKLIVTESKNLNSEETKNTEENHSLGVSDNPKWYLISDTHVKEVSVKDVLSAEAYILFYRRI